MADPEIKSPQAPSPAPMRRSLRIVLVASLGFNLLVLGLVAGAVLSGRIGGHPPHGIDLTAGPVTQALDAVDRRAIRDALRRRADLRAPSAAARAAAAATLAAAVRAEPFDRDAVAEVLTAQDAFVRSIQVAAQEAFLDRLAAMAPAARQALADRIAAGMRHDRDRGRDGDDDNDDS